ncbi:hypothetical protein GGQ80_000436 [Sphingomonas jinjuensis]|uniref:DUF1491 family protein n=1 Tax=Sphingomonas jinjuensis TaxID=535907 RepID=A0A840F3Z1_9SPHN|nr:DUF1491 family protein [Sphingomonas jinjuensis]MBB4152560.1 hypothetical protein [Sphingomonas jinjuensis]
MSGRLPTALAIGALLRRVNDSGGLAVVRARGDEQAGGVLLILEERDGPTRVVERGIGPDGQLGLIETTPSGDVEGYWRRRRSSDPDLWVVALDVAHAERFAAETIAAS